MWYDFRVIKKGSGTLKLYCGDCVREMRKIPCESVHLILTDPPYNIGAFMESRNVGIHRLKGRQNFVQDKWDNGNERDFETLMSDFLNEAQRVLVPLGALVLFTSFQQVSMIQREAEKRGLYYKTTGVWHRSNPMPRNMNLQFINSCDPWMYFLKTSRSGKKTGTFNNRGMAFHDCISCGVAPKTEKEISMHPTQKPEMLMRTFVDLLSNEGETVLDPFMGGGTTGVACIHSKREFIGIEMNQEYFDRAKRRLETESGT